MAGDEITTHPNDAQDHSLPIQYDNMNIPNNNVPHSSSSVAIPTQIYRSNSLPIEYLIVPLNIIFVVIAVLLLLKNKVGVMIF